MHGEILNRLLWNAHLPDASKIHLITAGIRCVNEKDRCEFYVIQQFVMCKATNNIDNKSLLR